MAATITITPCRASSSLTKPMRRMLVSRSSLLNPSPFERWVRTTSPSSISTAAPAARRRVSIRFEMVLLPAPESPVNQRTKPLCTPASQHLLDQHIHGPLHSAVGGKVNTALLVAVPLPPPTAGALTLAWFDSARARIAADAGIAARVEGMARNIVQANVFVHLRGCPVS